jgi:hypothetical protein
MIDISASVLDELRAANAKLINEIKRRTPKPASRRPGRRPFAKSVKVE